MAIVYKHPISEIIQCHSTHCYVIFYVALLPNAGHGLLIHEVSK